MMYKTESELTESVSLGATMTPESLFLSLLLSAIAYYKIYRPESERELTNIPNVEPLPEYDFIVVGGGSAGAVVANRLSENSNWNVLLLEAGGVESDLSDIPLYATSLQLGEMDWQYKAEPQETSCLAMKEHRCNWPRGKVIGGSSVLNYMLYVRGNKNDYDYWESLGNKGWGYKDVLKYFLKSEDNRNPSLAKSPYHRDGGYLTVSEAPYRTPLVSRFFNAGLEMGYPNRDVNGENQTGFMMVQGTARDGHRCSTAKAFLQPVKDRDNLHISLHSYVTKIMIDPKTKKAFGVEFVKNDKMYRVSASKEVILSAGTINSAQLLLLSGIGPSEELAKHQIPLIQNLQVGENLQDHVGLGGFSFIINETISLDDKLLSFNTLMEYAVNGEGPLSTFVGAESIGFVNTKYVNSSENYPDIELILLSANAYTDPQIYGLTETFSQAVFEPIKNLTIWSILPILLRPKSRGSIKLKSSNPYDYPYLYPNYFTEEQDIKTLIEGVKLAYAMSKTTTLQEIDSQFNPNIFPACINIEKYTDDFWECMIRQFTFTVYHQVGTAKMGPHWDPDAVVDHELKVYGVEGLRVIDASIMPHLVSAHTNAPVIMIAEKGSAMVKKYWLKRRKSTKPARGH